MPQTRSAFPRIAALGAAALLASGCATLGSSPREPEFVGRTLRVETSNGQASNLSFHRDGTVVARFGSQESRGSWDLGRRELCFTWAGNFRECWPHAEPFRTGRTETIRSDRGNVVRVTMLR